MTRDDIISMAREAGFDPHDMSDDFSCNLEDIELFAALVAAAEREACAKACEMQTNAVVARHPARIEFDPENIMAKKCAAAIRGRKEE